MATVTLRARGTADPSTVWERYADPQLWSTWSPQVQRVTSSTPRLEAGTTGTVRAGLFARPTVPVLFEVTDVDEAEREWAWRAWLGPVQLRLEHGVGTEVAGSSTWLRVHGPALFVAAYAPVAQLALRRLVAQ